MDPGREIKKEEIKNIAETPLAAQGGTINASLPMPATEGTHQILFQVFDENSTIIFETTSRFSIVNLDNMAPALERQEPGNTEENVEPNQFIAFYFNKPMDFSLLTVEVKETVHGKVYPEAEGGRDITRFSNIELIDINRERQDVSGNMSWFPENTMAAFYPSQDFGYGATVYVNLTYNGAELAKSVFSVRPLPTFIQGFVIDEDMNPVESITVTLAEINRSVTTNGDGAFGFGFGQPAEKDIPPGMYTVVINQGRKNRNRSELSFKINVIEGRLNDAGMFRLPSLKDAAFGRVVSGQADIRLDRGNITLNLENADLTFPDGRNAGDVAVNYIPLGKLPHSFLNYAVPMGCYMVQPPGIDVNGHPSVTLKLPEINGDYQYMNVIQDRVVLLGFSPDAMMIIPVGVGLINKTAHTITSEGALTLKNLDYIGYMFVGEDIKTTLEDYAKGLVDLNQLINALASR